MKNVLIYDSESDTLLIRKKGAEVDVCIDDDNDLCILELDKKKNIVGLEFLDVHSSFKIPLKVLNNLRDSRVHIHYEEAKKTIYIMITLLYEKESEKIMVPVNSDLWKGDFDCKNFCLCAA